MSKIDGLADFRDADHYLSWLKTHHDVEVHPEKLKTYFLKTTDSYSQCIGLEFLLMNGYVEAFDQLLEQNNQSRSKRNREWAYLYNLFMMKQKRALSKSELLELAQNFRTDEVELQCIQLFLEISIYFDIFDYSMVANRLDPLRIN